MKRDKIENRSSSLTIGQAISIARVAFLPIQLSGNGLLVVKPAAVGVAPSFTTHGVKTGRLLLLSHWQTSQCPQLTLYS